MAAHADWLDRLRNDGAIGIIYIDFITEAEAFAKDFAAATAALAKPATEGIASALAKAAGPFDAQEEGSDSMGEEA